MEMFILLKKKESEIGCACQYNRRISKCLVKIKIKYVRNYSTIKHIDFVIQFQQSYFDIQNSFFLKKNFLQENICRKFKYRKLKLSRRKKNSKRCR